MGRKKSNPKKKIHEELDLDSIEKETMKRVGHTLNTIEKFLTKWDETKPESMHPQVIKIKRFHDALENWKREAIKNKGKENDGARMRRIQDFVLLCQTYS